MTHGILNDYSQMYIDQEWYMTQDFPSMQNLVESLMVMIGFGQLLGKRILVEIQSQLFDIHPISSSEDKATWTASKSGIYHANATWNKLRKHYDSAPWYSMVWFKHAIPRHSFIVWLAILNRLLTRDRMKKWMPSIGQNVNFAQAQNQDVIFSLNTYIPQSYGILLGVFSLVIFH